MDDKTNIMKTKKVFPLLISMSLPPMFSMMMQSLYNIVDSIYVAKISKDALTAVSLVFPLQNLALAVAVGFGIGANALVARNLGAKNKERTNSAATHGFLCTAVHSILFVLIGIFLTKPFISMFTSNEEVYRMGCTYSYIVVTFAAGKIFHVYIEKLFQASGNMIVPMAMQAMGCVLNVILDPIMIFGLFGFPKMGVAGAAIATIISEISAGVISTVYFFSKKDMQIKISFKNFKFDKLMLKNLYMVAIPSGVMMSLPSILVGILNGLIGSINEVAVAAFGVYYKLQTFVYMPASGVTQGMRPIISYNYGAKNYDRLHKTVKSAIILTFGISLLGTILFTAFPTQIISIFDKDVELLKYGEDILRIISLGFCVSTVGFVLPASFEALGKGPSSLLVSLVRQLLIIPPLAFVLSKSIGLTGIWIAFPVAECVAAIVAYILYKKINKTLQ